MRLSQKGWFRLPIKGLTDTRRMPRIGKIRIGEKTEKGAPHALDYFIGPPEFHEQFGRPGPQEITIVFPTDATDSNGDPEVFRTRLQRYTLSGLQCYGDGEQAHERQHDGLWKDIPCPCPFLRSPENPKGTCQFNGYLMFQIPDIPDNMIGVYQLGTSSRNSIRRLGDQLAQLTNDFGTFAGFPLRLVVRFEEVPHSIPDDRNPGRMRQVTARVPVLHLRKIGTDEEARKAAWRYMHERRTLGGTIHLEEPDYADRPETLYGDLDIAEEAAAEQAAAVRTPDEPAEVPEAPTAAEAASDPTAPRTPDWVTPGDQDAPPPAPPTQPRAAPTSAMPTAEQTTTMQTLWRKLGIPPSRQQAELRGWQSRGFTIESYITNLEEMVRSVEQRRSRQAAGAKR